MEGDRKTAGLWDTEHIKDKNSQLNATLKDDTHGTQLLRHDK